jgi:hypothetical protein
MGLFYQRFYRKGQAGIASTEELSKKGKKEAGRNLFSKISNRLPV